MARTYRQIALISKRVKKAHVQGERRLCVEQLKQNPAQNIIMPPKTPPRTPLAQCLERLTLAGPKLLPPVSPTHCYT